MIKPDYLILMIPFLNTLHLIYSIFIQTDIVISGQKMKYFLLFLLLIHVLQMSCVESDPREAVSRPSS